MKVSLKWLAEYIDIPADIKELCDRLDLTGTGVEGVEKTGAQLDRVVTGRIITKTQHPDSDHMWVCMVDVGAANLDDTGVPEPLQIVCGAQNFNAGDHVVVALVGAVLPGDIKIKKSKLRGVTSCGMNCSERELGLGSDHEGIMILPEDAPIGVAFADYYGMSDTVLDLEITPNRSDCLSITGIARELGAVYQCPWRDPLSKAADHLAAFVGGEAAAHDANVVIDDSARCSRYSARIIRNVKVGPSPDWMVERLAAIGQRSINNIVDVTNYILFLFGQPLHAFDFDKLVDTAGKAHVVVRAAYEGEHLTTLDGIDRVLNSDMTVIATPERAVALAGVMGGLETEVTDTTTNILLEAAVFEAGRTSRTSRTLGLVSESSMRYERGVDDYDVDIRSAAAAALIAEVSGGIVAPGIIDVWSVPSEPSKLKFRTGRFNAMMGTAIPSDFIVNTLERLGCSVEITAQAYTQEYVQLAASDTQANVSCDELSVTVPTFRPDLEREIDLYEEVLRLWGMDKVEATLPGGRGRFGVRTPDERALDVVHTTMRACGLNETMTSSFADPHDLEAARMDASALELCEPVELINPMSTEQSIMRQSIIPGLLRSVAYNHNRGVKNVQLYEIGVVFFASQGRKQPKERRRLAGVMTGAMSDAAWNVSLVSLDFFDGKGVVENLLRELAVDKVRFKALSANEASQLQPGRAAAVYVGGVRLGWIGEMHPLATAAFDIEGTVVAFELDLETLLKAVRPARDYVDVPTFPAVSMDVAFVVDEEVSCEKLVQCMRSAGGKLLEDVRLFDVYRDEKRLGANKKSMAFALNYRASDRTLTSEEASKTHERLVKKVCGATGAQVRG